MDPLTGIRRSSGYHNKLKVTGNWIWEDYLVIIKNLSYLKIRLRMKCQSLMGWPLSSERSLVTLRKKNEKKWMKMKSRMKKKKRKK